MWGWWANAAVRDALHFVVYDQDQSLKEKIDMVRVAEVINTNNVAGALELWNQAKRNLQPVVTWWNEQGIHHSSLEDSHPLLDTRNLMRLDFLAANKALKGKLFNFSKWCRRQYDRWGSYKARAFYNGFPSAASELCAANPEWDAFSKEWTLDRDLISKPLLA